MAIIKVNLIKHRWFALIPAVQTTLIMKSNAASKNRKLKEDSLGRKSLDEEGPLLRKAQNKQYSREIWGETLLLL